MRLPAQGRARRTLGAKERTRGLGIPARWCAKAKASGIRQLLLWRRPSFARLGGPELLPEGLTSGKMEGLNRKIRGLLASAFGFRDRDFLKLRLYALHEARKGREKGFCNSRGDESVTRRSHRKCILIVFPHDPTRSQFRIRASVRSPGRGYPRIAELSNSPRPRKTRRGFDGSKSRRGKT